MEQGKTLFEVFNQERDVMFDEFNRDEIDMIVGALEAMEDRNLKAANECRANSQGNVAKHYLKISKEYRSLIERIPAKA